MKVPKQIKAFLALSSAPSVKIEVGAQEAFALITLVMAGLVQALKDSISKEGSPLRDLLEGKTPNV